MNAIKEYFRNDSPVEWCKESIPSSTECTSKCVSKIKPECVNYCTTGDTSTGDNKNKNRSLERAADRGKGDGGGAGSPSGNGSNGTNSLTIRVRQKMMGAPLTYNFRNYFPTYNAPENTADSSACNSGFASIWTVDRLQNTALRWKSKTNGVQNEAQVGTVSGTKSTEAGTASTFAKDHYINLNTGTLVYGLTMTPQIICMNGNTIKVAAPMLVAQTGQAAGVTGAGVTGSGKDSSGKATNIAPGKDATIQVMSVNEEAIQAEAQVLSWASVYE